jgi:hypothetical protein
MTKKAHWTSTPSHRWTRSIVLKATSSILTQIIETLAIVIHPMIKSKAIGMTLMCTQAHELVIIMETG